MSYSSDNILNNKNQRKSEKESHKRPILLDFTSVSTEFLISCLPKLGLAKLLMPIFISSTLLVITACSDDKPLQTTHNSYGEILISDDTIILTSSHIATIKSKLYQPSLTLYGLISPVQEIMISLDKEIILDTVFVKNGQSVKKNDTLALYKIPAKPLAVLPTKEESLSNNKDNSIHQSDNSPIPEKIGKNIKSVDAQQITHHNDNTIEKAAEHKADEPMADILEFKAPFSGKISELSNSNVRNAAIPANSHIMKISTPEQLEFISLLPKHTKMRLTIGQNVSFMIEGFSREKPFTGQISDIIEVKETNDIAIHVHILPDKDVLSKIGMPAQGKVDYGQLDIGTLVSNSAIHGTDLSIFTAADGRVAAPLKAYVWIVNQKQHLVRQPIEVVSYDQINNQYLVSGIPSDSLIILANLPEDSAGKLLKIS